MHDHPFDFVSVLLSGGYTEHTPAGVKRWPRFSVVRKGAEDAHRLEVDRPVWTLVFGGKVRREWGFVTPEGYLTRTQYEARFGEGVP
jgi:hypothetical protein